MPINSIAIQPAPDSIKPAYRPVVFHVEATQTGATATNFIPPVVFCDIYINGVFYKSMYKTHPANKPVYDDTENRPKFEFDIQDACQEVLKSNIQNIGLDEIIEDGTMIAGVYCRFRSSSINSEGITLLEGIEPIQATGSMRAVTGTGEKSNVFYIVNTTVQHENYQELLNLLTMLKKRTWSSLAYPLTQRPDKYRICSGDNDVFSFLYTGLNRMKCIRLKYKPKGATSFESVQSCVELPECDPVLFAEDLELPNAQEGIIYNQIITMAGSGPFEIDVEDTNVPSWMQVSMIGNDLHISGVPLFADITEGVAVVIKVTNGCASATHTDEIAVVAAPACVPVEIVGTPTLPDVQSGQAYSYSIPITGTAPFTLSGVVKPSGWSIAIVGNTVQITGTAGLPENDVPIQFTVNNCSGSTAEFSQAIDIGPVTVSNGFVITNESTGGVIDDVTPYFYLGYTGAFPIEPSDGDYEGHQGGWSSTIFVKLSGTVSGELVLEKNSVEVESIVVSAPGTYKLNYYTPVSFLSTDSMKIKLTD